MKSGTSQWKKPGRNSLGAFESFLRSKEPYCTGACFRYLSRTGKDRLWYMPGTSGAAEKKSPVDVKAVMIYTGRALFPVFDLSSDEISMPGSFWRMQRTSPLHAAQGLTDDIDILERSLERKGFFAAQKIDYDLMQMAPGAFLPAETAPLPCESKILPIIRRPGIEDIDGLFPLQAGYEIEEVLPRGAQFNPAVTRRGLEQLLSGGMVLAAEAAGRLVGKININAESFTRLQIGGVYVDPGYRGRGIAKMMTLEMIRLLSPLGKNFCLFVKKKNISAIKAYIKVGFTKFADYRINYYA